MTTTLSPIIDRSGPHCGLCMPSMGYCLPSHAQIPSRPTLAGYRSHVLGISHAPTHRCHVRPVGPFPSPFLFYLSMDMHVLAAQPHLDPPATGSHLRTRKPVTQPCEWLRSILPRGSKQLSKLGANNLFCLTSASLYCIDFLYTRRSRLLLATNSHGPASNSVSNKSSDHSHAPKDVSAPQSRFVNTVVQFVEPTRVEARRDEW